MYPTFKIFTEETVLISFVPKVLFKCRLLTGLRKFVSQFKS